MVSFQHFNFFLICIFKITDGKIKLFLFKDMFKYKYNNVDFEKINKYNVHDMIKTCNIDLPF